MSEMDGKPGGGWPGNAPGRTPEVESLLKRAAAHPLGYDFITNGSPDAISATFGVHAFIVDAAREMLETPSPTIEIGVVRDSARVYNL